MEYRDVNLYPFDDNLFDSVSSFSVQIPLEELIAMCDWIVGSIADLEAYTVDYVHAYGTDGRRLYYKIFYKRVLTVWR